MEPSPSSSPPLSLLVVEDDPETRELNCRLLAMKFPDLIIYGAENGSTGVDLCVKHAPDIVITDINLPGMDGIRMAEKIKSVKADTQFIVLTGYSDKVHLDEFSCVGTPQYLLKPIDFQRLFTIIESCIDEVMQARRQQSRHSSPSGR